MKIYAVKVDVNKFQYFLPEDEKIYQTDRLIFDGTPKLAQWTPPPVYVYMPKLRRGNFLTFMGGGLVADQRALEGLREFFEMAGELLPLPHQGEMFHIANVTECINALDQQQTEWVVRDGVRVRIKRHAFHPNRMSSSSLFKIPETCRTQILTYERLGNPDQEFKPAVERLGLKGLIFEELWSDEG